MSKTVPQIIGPLRAELAHHNVVGESSVGCASLARVERDWKAGGVGRPAPNVASRDHRARAQRVFGCQKSQCTMADLSIPYLAGGSARFWPPGVGGVSRPAPNV
jgi:hypothetical protein